jgi:hypothetical protein
MKTNALAVVIVLNALASGAPARANNIVVNGGFETGDLTGWSVSPILSVPPSTPQWSVSSTNPYDGTYSAWAQSNSVLYQIVPTIPERPYQLSFAFNPGPNNEALVLYWAGGYGSRVAMGEPNIWALYTWDLRSPIPPYTTSQLGFAEGGLGGVCSGGICVGPPYEGEASDRA